MRTACLAAAVAGVGSPSLAGHTTGGGAYVGTPIAAGSAADVKLRAAIAEVAANWNVFTANRLTRMADAGQICVETGTTASAANALGDGNDATINIKLGRLCDPALRGGLLLHELAHTTYPGSGPVEHCRVWFIEYKYVRSTQANFAVGSAEHNALVNRQAQIELWYGNFAAAYANGGADAPIPAPTPLPGTNANQCQTAMASIQPPTGGPHVVAYTIFGTNRVECWSW